MKRLALGAVFAGLSLVVAVGPTAAPSASGPEPGPVYVAAAVRELPVGSAAHAARPVASAALTETVQRYCVVCHNDRMLTGNLSLQTFDVENAQERVETAEKMIRK